MKAILGKIVLIILVVGLVGWAVNDPEAFTDTASSVLRWAGRTCMMIVRSIFEPLGRSVE